MRGRLHVCVLCFIKIVGLIKDGRSLFSSTCLFGVAILTFLKNPCVEKNEKNQHFGLFCA